MVSVGMDRCGTVQARKLANAPGGVVTGNGQEMSYGSGVYGMVIIIQPS